MWHNASVSLPICLSQTLAAAICELWVPLTAWLQSSHLRYCEYSYPKSKQNVGFHFVFHTERPRTFLWLKHCCSSTVISFKSITSCKSTKQAAWSGLWRTVSVSLMTTFWVDRQPTTNLWLVNYQGVHRGQRQLNRAGVHLPCFCSVKACGDVLSVSGNARQTEQAASAGRLKNWPRAAGQSGLLQHTGH